jgi:hypothetical protein
LTAEQASNIKLMDAEVTPYWKIMCKHLHAEAQVNTEPFLSLYATFSLVEAYKNKITNKPLSPTL